MAFVTRPELTGTYGMVSSTHWLATAVAMRVLELGGNAFDASVAAGFAFQVVEPYQNGPGGDLVLSFARGDEKRPTVLCAQGPAPAAASLQAFADLGLSVIPGSGPLAAAIPGATVGWLTLLRDHGTMTLGDVLAYAIGYARDGYPVTAKMSETIRTVEQLFREHWRYSAELYLRNGGVPKAGDFINNPTLAETYERLVKAEQTARGTREQRIDAAIHAWTQGFVAEAIDRFARTEWRDSSGTNHAGLLTGADLANWRPRYETPETYRFRGYDIYKAGPWSQGPVLLQQLSLLEDLDLTPGTPDSVHQVIECAKLAFADRDAWYGDTDDVPLATLLSPEYNAERRRLLGDHASYDLRPGSPDHREPRFPAVATAARAGTSGDGSLGEPNATRSDGSLGEPNIARVAQPETTATGVHRSDTVHIDVIDRWGNIVAAMPSGGWLQSSPVNPELGFCLGTRLQIAWLDPGLPNSLAPGKRPRTTLSPTLVMRAGEPILACGSPGGDQQDQWQLCFLLQRLVGGLDLQAAIDAPTFHTLHFPSSFDPHESEPGVVVMEDRFGEAGIAELRARGHRVVKAGDWALGYMCAVARDPDRKTLSAGASPRGNLGYAAGR